MRIETFCRRLCEGKGVHYLDKGMGGVAFISIWLHETTFVLTWEEFAEHDFYNEQNYTRDEVHQFQDVCEVLAFLEKNTVNPRQFKP